MEQSRNIEKINKPENKFDLCAKSIYDRFPFKNEKVNIDRARSFLKDHGFDTQKTKIIFLLQDDKNDRYQEVLEIMRANNIDDKFIQRFSKLCRESTAKASYEPKLNLVFFRQHTIFNDSLRNGEIVIEGIALHELVHSKEIQHHINDDLDNPKLSRVGFATMNKGVINGRGFNEALPEMMRAMYISKYSENTELYSLLKKYGPCKSIEDLIDVGKIKIPAKYCEMGLYDIKVYPSSYIGYALELVCHKNQKIFNLLKLFYQGNTSALKELIHEMNSIHPKLYKLFKETKYTEESMINTLIKVQEIINQ
ncbi:MAG: hypothetical protein KBC12_00815 [Candidatus Pacebacteria bacterium]|nr:hypothetical protein [Candidatus Paceibacterota bacterium]